MKPLRLILALFSALGIFGCSQKKPVLVAPQQPPPTAPQPTPTPEPTVAEQPQPAQPAPTPEEQTTSTTATKTKPKRAKSARHTAAKKPAPPANNSDKTANEVAKNNTSKTVIPPEKPTEKNDVPLTGQISPVPTPADASHTQTSTEQLLQSAEGNLNSIKRQLSKDEEAMCTQIREFIIQSHKAISENDLARAHNLAVKARLLSDELVKKR